MKKLKIQRKWLILNKTLDFMNFVKNSENKENRAYENRLFLTIFTRENGHFLAVFRVGPKKD